MSTTTHTLIRATAEITRIASLAAGDVYKRLDTSSGDKLFFGIVTEVLHNGEEAAIVAVEYSSEYFGASVTRKVFANDRPVAIFPASPEEFVAKMGDVLTDARRNLKTKEADLRKAQEVLAECERAALLTPNAPALATETADA